MAKTLNPNSGKNNRQSYYEQVGCAKYTTRSGRTFEISSQSKKQNNHYSTSSNTKANN